jgi:hypothetical protein
MERLGVKMKMSTSAHPETDGRAEATNKVVGQTLRILCEDTPDGWLEVLPMAKFAINTSASSATGMAPFDVVHGFLPASFPALAPPVPYALDSGFSERARLNALRATDAIIASRIAMTHDANKHRRDEGDLFAVGSKAYVSSSAMRLAKGISSKFVPKYLGPYEIIKASPATSSYTLALPPHLRIHPTFHASRLRPHFANDDSRFPSRSFSTPPPVVLASDAAEAEWEVEKLVGERKRYGKVEYKVRYLGYSPSEDQWRPASEVIKTAPELVKEFKERARLAKVVPPATPPAAPAGRLSPRRLAAFLPDRSFSGGVGVSPRLTPSTRPHTRSPSTSPIASSSTSLGYTNRFAVLEEVVE